MMTNPVYNASSQTTQMNLGNTTQEQYTFDPQTGFLTNQKVVQGATTHVDLSYDYGNLYAGGNVTWKTGQLSKITDNKNTNRNRQYKYDRLGRLIEAKGGATFNLWTQTYNYDQFGNRTTQSASGSAANGSAINSDGIGNLTFNTATNRITSANFAYDAAGNQTQSNEGGQVQNYRYDAAGRLLAIDAASNGIQYHHSDELGTRLVTTTSGTISSENVGLPFGTTITGESNNLAGSASKKRFTSYDRSDTTKLDYAMNRHYSTSQGRFTQVDPIGMNAVYLTNPQSLNLYVYCFNDPINYVDPSGLFVEAGGAAAGGPVGIIVAAVLAVIQAWRLISRGRAKTRVVGRTSQRLAQIETGDRGAWIQPTISAGVGAINSLLANTEKEESLAEKNLKLAIEDALEALKNPACRALLTGKGGNPAAVLQALRNRKNGFSIHRVEGRAETSDLSGRNSGQGLGKNTIIHMDNTNLTDDDFAATNGMGNIRDPRVSRAVTVLHETGHATGATPWDPNSMTHTGKLGKEEIINDPDKINIRIATICFPGKGKTK